MKKNMIAH